MVRLLTALLIASFLLPATAFAESSAWQILLGGDDANTPHLFDGSGALYYTRTRGTTGSRTVSWVVRGRGAVSLRIGSCRVGWTTRDVKVG